MPRVTFKFDIVKDAVNYYMASNSDSLWGHDFSKAVKPEITNKVRGKTWENSRSYLIKMLEKGYSADKKINQKRSRIIKSSWKKVEKRYFRKLEKITKRKIYIDKFTCYFTTIGRCPYNYKGNWFMVNIFSHDIKRTAAHELMHLQFHYYFQDYVEDKLGHSKFEDLKEALTVLLNIEFKDITDKKDTGYPNHQKLRKFIVEQWKKEPDFDILIDKCVNYLKK